MYGAIEFMRAWRELCQESRCNKCEAHEVCMIPHFTSPWALPDEAINKLIGIVMSKKAQREKEENK